MKTFNVFLEEAKKKEKIRKLTKDFEKKAKQQIKKAKKENKPAVVDYGDHPPGSPERVAAIKAMMSRQGASAF